MDQQQLMFDIYNKCCDDLSDFEIWDGYYKLRFEEFKKFYSILPQKHFSRSLEIGCGIGYQAAFLSVISDSIVASDVDYGDMIQHSRGLEITRNFVEKSGIKNIEVVNANSENLPFADEQFDFIFASYSFQYIVDKDKALQEIRRVLKKDGYFFCVLPTSINRFRAALRYYKEIFLKISRKFQRNLDIEKSISAAQNKITFQKKWFSKLLPPADNSNNNVIKEYFLYSPICWENLFLKNKLKIVSKKFSAFSVVNNNLSIFKKITEKLKSDGIILITKK